MEVVATEIDPVAVECARSNGIEVFEGSRDESFPDDMRVDRARGQRFSGHARIERGPEYALRPE